MHDRSASFEFVDTTCFVSQYAIETEASERLRMLLLLLLLYRRHQRRPPPRGRYPLPIASGRRFHIKTPLDGCLVGAPLTSVCLSFCLFVYALSLGLSRAEISAEDIRRTVFLLCKRIIDMKCVLAKTGRGIARRESKVDGHQTCFSAH